MRLKNKVAIVTGGASGIGAACCELLAREGAKVAIADLNETLGTALAQRLNSQGLTAKFYKQDVTCEQTWATIFKTVDADFGAVTTLVNNAGIGLSNNICDTTMEEWNKVILVNQTSVFLGMREAVNHMKVNGGGSIINMCSVMGLVGDSWSAAYNASKGAVRLMTKSAALHSGEQGYNIRVNSLHPGFVNTDLVKDEFAKLPTEMYDDAVAAHPIGRFAEASEIANGVVFLASDESSFMTGSELVIDGGYTAR